MSMIDQVIQIAQQAWDIILEEKKKWLSVSMKSDTGTWADYLTQADLLADAFISKSLKELYPTHGLLTEETADLSDSPDRSWSVWIIDPIDGTKNYATGSEDYGVLIGRCDGWVPVLWVSYFPEKNMLLSAMRWKGAFLNGTLIDRNIKEIDNNVVQLSKPSDLWISYKDWKYVNKAWFSLVGIKGRSSMWLSLIEIALWNIGCKTWRIPWWKRDTCAWHVLLEELWWQCVDMYWKKLDYTSESHYWTDWVCAWNKKTCDDVLSFVGHTKT